MAKFCGAHGYHSSERLQICSIVCRDPFFHTRFPEIRYIPQVALTIPLSTTWRERGFSFLKRIKTSHRNRFLNETFSALLHISINHALVGDEEIQSAAQKLLGGKERRIVSKRGLKNLRVVESRQAEGENKNALLTDAQNIDESDRTVKMNVKTLCLWTDTVT